MTRTFILSALAGMIFAAPAFAHDDHRCGNVPPDRWMSRQQVMEKAGKLGIDVREIEIDDGCYDVEGRFRDGRRVELRLHPENGATIAVDGD